jgi:hypothetical protein
MRMTKKIINAIYAHSKGHTYERHSGVLVDVKIIEID